MNPTRFSGPALPVLTIVIGAFLRFESLGQPSYWLDEILSDILTTKVATQPWWHWLTGLDPENGPLFFALRLASRAISTSEAAGRFPFALLGVATIPVLWFAGSGRERAIDAGWACAFFLCVSPLNVYYSREARPYALLMFLTATLVLALLRSAKPAVVAAILIALLYTSATAAPVLAAAVVAASAAFITRAPRRRSGDWGIVAMTTCATLLVPLLYRGTPWAHGKKEFPALSMEFASTLLHTLSVSAVGSAIDSRTAGALFVFAAIGASAMLRRDRRNGFIVLSMTVLPIVFAIIPLVITGHFFATRYVSPGVIGFILLAGTGVSVLARWLAAVVARTSSFRGTVAFVLTVAVVGAVATENWPVARREPFQKLDWRAIAEVLMSRVKPGDVVALAEPYSFVSLGYYIKLPREVDFVLVDFVGVGEQWVAKSQASWLVTAGYSTPVSAWMCRYPLILASPLEAFRLHYAPSRSHFLASRSAPSEQRAISRAAGAGNLTMQLGPEDDVFLGEGWAGPDVSRWGTGRRSTLTFPRGPKTDRVIRFHAYPLTHSTLPVQTMRVTLNGAVLVTLALAPEWRDYEIHAPADRWIDGINTLTFDFARATAPSAIDQSSPDHRELSTSFDRISIDDAGFAPRQETAKPRVLTIRAGAGGFLDAPTVWRNSPTRLPARRLRRDAVELLLARLGFDPVSAWPRLASGEVRLDDVVETIAYGGDCEDHASFLRRAFGILLMRAPSSDEEKDLLARLTADPSRVAIIGRIVKSDEFRGQVLAP